MPTNSFINCSFFRRKNSSLRSPIAIMYRQDLLVIYLLVALAFISTSLTMYSSCRTLIGWDLTDDGTLQAEEVAQLARDIGFIHVYTTHDNYSYQFMSLHHRHLDPDCTEEQINSLIELYENIIIAHPNVLGFRRDNWRFNWIARRMFIPDFEDAVEPTTTRA